MNPLRIVAVLVVGLVVASCQTIVEDLPASTYDPPSSAPVPIVVIQLPPPAPLPSVPTSSPHGGALQRRRRRPAAALADESAGWR